MRKILKKINWALLPPFFAAAVCAAVLFWVTAPKTRRPVQCIPGRTPSLRSLDPDLSQTWLVSPLVDSPSNPEPSTPDHAAETENEIRSMMQRDISAGLSRMADGELKSRELRGRLLAFVSDQELMDLLKARSSQSLALMEQKTLRYHDQIREIFINDEFYHEMMDELFNLDLKIIHLGLKAQDPQRYASNPAELDDLKRQYDNIKRALESYRQIKLQRLALQYRQDTDAIAAEWEKDYKTTAAGVEKSLWDRMETVDKQTKAVLDQRLEAYRRWLGDHDSGARFPPDAGPASGPGLSAQWLPAMNKGDQFPRRLEFFQEPRRGCPNISVQGQTDEDWSRALIILIGCLNCGM